MIVRTSIWTESPVSISLRRGSGFSLQTQTYLPGPVLRGAIAAAYLERESGGAASRAFQRIFVEERARFLDHRLEGAFPWPASTRRCTERPDDHSLEN